MPMPEYTVKFASTPLSSFNVDRIYSMPFSLNPFPFSVIRNIFRKKEYLNKIDELVLPLDLLIYNGKTVGFSMPYIQGNTLYDIIRYNLLDEEEDLMVLQICLS